jgi:hypothetical protein
MRLAALADATFAVASVAAPFRQGASHHAMRRSVRQAAARVARLADAARDAATRHAIQCIAAKTPYNADRLVAIESRLLSRIHHASRHALFLAARRPIEQLDMAIAAMCDEHAANVDKACAAATAHKRLEALGNVVWTSKVDVTSFLGVALTSAGCESRLASENAGSIYACDILARCAKLASARRDFARAVATFSARDVVASLDIVEPLDIASITST